MTKISKEDIQNTAVELKKYLNEAKNQKEVEELRIKYLGRKGKFSSFTKTLSDLPIETRKELGKLLNSLQTELKILIKKKEKEFLQDKVIQQTKEYKIDVSLPGYPIEIAHPHPLTQIIEKITLAFLGLGFQIATGPDIETDYYNFEALNIPQGHPARDMQDTFYIAKTNKQLLLRTHTSPVQIRVMEKYQPPIRVIVPGRVYRHEATDATHSHVFHQVEGLVVDQNITFAELKGVLTVFAKKIFSEDIPVRFRPSYFPFTEPSAEMDIMCEICKGKGCRVCKNSGWLEILGCGMVNPKVFDAVKYDREKYTGYAFGMGVERIALLKYRIEDMRLLFENNLKFLTQF